MNKFNKKLSYLALSSALVATSSNVMAGPYGYDLHNVLAPRSAAMAGTSIAEPLDNVSAIYGNPATIAQFRGTDVTFGATWYKPEVDLTHDGSESLIPFKAENGNEGYIVPQVGITQDLRALGLPATLGAGLTAVSGIGAEFREDVRTQGTGAEFIVLGANLGLGWDLTPNLAIGGALTVTYAMLDLGLAGTSQQTHDVSARGAFGLDYTATPDTKIGLMYHTKLKHNFDDIVLVGNGLFNSGVAAFTAPAAVAGVPLDTGTFRDLKVEQPRDIGLGISNRSLMGGNLYLAADVMWKNWEDTEFWGDIYEDQWVMSVGAELSHGPWRFRAGYGYAEDPTKENPTTLAGLSNVCAGITSACIPLAVDQGFIEYAQASQAEVIYEHRVTAGVGYKGFLAPFLDIDTHVAYQIEGDREYGTGTLPSGAHSEAEVYSWHAGFALTWNF